MGHSNDIDRFRIAPGASVKMRSLKAGDTGRFKDKHEAIELMEKRSARIAELQDALYAESKRALLVVLQGMDTSGKDGTIRHVFGSVNPQGCIVTSFKAPSADELAHDYLWRIHKATPARGMIGIFNRSHYESLLIERVLNLVPDKVWSRRYEQVNEFEEMLTDEGTTIIKCFLNISKDEQRERLQARVDDRDKQWKFDPHDLEQRARWDAYMSAYADVLSKCSTKHAPWYAIPSDHKWYRNWAISEILVRTLEKMKPKYPAGRVTKDIEIV